MFPKPVLAPLPPHLCWEVPKIKKGEWVEGVLAGEVKQVPCHWSGTSSKPCLRFMSEGKLPCHCDKEPASLRVVGYVPIITKDRQKYVVVVSATTAYRLESVAPGKGIRLARPDKVKQAMNVVLRSDADIGEDFVKRMRPACMHDISEYLLHLWQNPILCLHFGVEHRPAGVASLLPPKENPAA